MSTKFCSYYVASGYCVKGDSCTFSHDMVIPRRPAKCTNTHASLEEKSLCVYMHEGEVWSRSMAPICHPFLRALEDARKENARLTAALAASEIAKNKALADLADADHVADLRDFLEMNTYIARDEEVLHYDPHGTLYNDKGVRCDKRGDTL